MRSASAFSLESATKTATTTLAPVDRRLARHSELVVTWKITSAERDTGNETYDLYITTQNQAGEKYDLVHFPQVATTGAKTFVARLSSQVLPQRVTTASPGVASNESGTIRTETGGAAEGAKTLAAGTVRHGPWGDLIGYELVIAGTIVTGIAFTITVEAR